MFRRGEIWLANLNPGRGTEPGKTRPVLIIQAESLLKAEHPSTVIVPLTTQLETGVEPLRIRVKSSEKLRHESDLLLDQLRAIDNSRFTQGPLCQLSRTQMEQVGQALKEVLELTEYDLEIDA